MKITNLFLGIVALIFVTIYSCKKKEEPTPTTAPSKTELLCGKNWKMIAATVNPAIDTGGGVPVTNLFPMKSCEDDNLLIFSTNHTCKINEGASKCNSADPQTYSAGTWTFNSTESVITLNEGTSDAQDRKIISLDASSLKLSFVQLDVTSSINYTYIFTFGL